MNNYISLNLVSGKLARYAGGGKPKFILGEQNDAQIYFLDYPKPSTYPTDSLGDAFSEITTRDYNSKSLTINAGKRGNNKILSTSSFFNLPNNFASSIPITITTETVRNLALSSYDYRVSFSGILLLEPIPTSDSLFRFTAYSSGNAAWAPPAPSTFSYQQTSEYFSFNNPSDIKNAIENTVGDIITYTINEITYTTPTKVYTKVFQLSDYSFSFQFIWDIHQSSSNISNFNLSIVMDTTKATANFGKYGYLDFSSPSWTSIIGTKNEVEIWMEAMIGSETIAQGNAIICRKMT
jgi:hypothetical protein